MVSAEIRDTFLKVVRPEIAGKAGKWLETSSVTEQKGLRVIGAIVLTHGQRKFKRRERADWFGGKSKNAGEELNRRALQSTYDIEYQDFGPHPQRNSLLFSYRKLTDLSYSSLLTDDAVVSLQKWLDLHDDEEYQQLVLECIRSISASLASSTSKNLSVSRKEYTWKSLPQRAAPLSARIEKQKTDLNSSPRPIAVEGKRSMTPTPVHGTALTAADLKKMKQALILGHRNLGRWIVAPEKVLSNYQEDYVPYFAKPQKRVVMDFNTSISLGKMCPDLNRAAPQNILNPA